LTDPVYRADMERRVAAATILWAPAIDNAYKHPAIEKLVDATTLRVVNECTARATLNPTPQDLIRMRDTGALPGEYRIVTGARHFRYRAFDAISSAAARLDEIEPGARRFLERIRARRRRDGG